ncbi:hypothetical protein AAHB62_26175 [Bacillus cereus]
MKNNSKNTKGLSKFISLQKVKKTPKKVDNDERDFSMAILEFGIEPEVFWNMTEREFFTLVIYDLQKKKTICYE